MNLNSHISLSFNGQCETAFKFYERCFGGTIAFMLRWGESPAAGDAPTEWRDKILHGTLMIPELPDYIATALKANPEAWKFFRKLAPTDRRQFVVWIHTAKRVETRNKRIRESIRLLAARKKLGLK